LAEHLWGGLRALTTGPKKVLVLDLDNTVWGGVVGETGPLGVGIGETPDGEGFLAFQRHAKGLAAQGVLLAVASKNNLADAREPFEHNPEMVLRLDDFAAFEAHWEPKATSLRRIAETLQLGLDSFVFFDDNPAEREHIRQALPDVEVVEVPVEPTEYVRALAAGQWFESNRLTEADRVRGRQYVEERKRRECQQSFGNLSDYLRSLEMSAVVRPIDEADLERVVQLLSKTNQFNLTTRRHSSAELLAILETPRSVCFSVRMRDKFGDHGLVAVVLAVPADDADVLRVDTWLMSCRVIGRTLESFTLSVLAGQAEQRGYGQLLGEYIETKKNGLVRDVYERHGFQPTGDPAASPRQFTLALEPQWTFPETFIAIGD
jgi:FkbH-like protein